MKSILATMAILAFVGLILLYEKSLWDECRQTNTVMYCLRILGT